MRFSELCDYLATTGGGYTLWIGAGAARAATRGATPTWNSLVEDIAQARPELANLPIGWDNMNMPDRLEHISSNIGHGPFRKELRRRVISTITPQSIDATTVVNQAVIGARAGAVVSFNIEPITAYAFTGSHGGVFIARTYLEKSKVERTRPAKPGMVAAPVYFPHGLLDEGNCVMTSSEYARHKMSLAVQTAVALCLGGDLLILGMSLADSYLRQAILEQRRWIRNVYWITSGCPYTEWARVADVTCIEATHQELWTGIAKAHLDADTSGELPKRVKTWTTVLPGLISNISTISQQHQAHLDSFAATVVQNPNSRREELHALAEHSLDLGLDIPACISSDPRFT